LVAAEPGVFSQAAGPVAAAPGAVSEAEPEVFSQAAGLEVAFGAVEPGAFSRAVEPEAVSETAVVLPPKGRARIRNLVRFLKHRFRRDIASLPVYIHEVAPEAAAPVVVFEAAAPEVALEAVGSVVVFEPAGLVAVSGADVAEHRASVDIALAFDVSVPASAVAVEVGSPGRPRFSASPNVDHYANPSSSAEAAGWGSVHSSIGARTNHDSGNVLSNPGLRQNKNLELRCNNPSPDHSTVSDTSGLPIDATRSHSRRTGLHSHQGQHIHRPCQASRSHPEVTEMQSVVDRKKHRARKVVVDRKHHQSRRVAVDYRSRRAQRE
jgi:hypothetical protein